MNFQIILKFDRPCSIYIKFHIFRGSHLSLFEFSLKYATCSCLSSNTPLFREFRNVVLSPCLLQLQQYCFVPSTCFKIRLPAYRTYVHRPGPIVQVHLEVTPHVWQFHHGCPLASCCTGALCQQDSPNRALYRSWAMSSVAWSTSTRQTYKSPIAALFPLWHWTCHCDFSPSDLI